MHSTLPMNAERTNQQLSNAESRCSSGMPSTYRRTQFVARITSVPPAHSCCLVCHQTQTRFAVIRSARRSAIHRSTSQPTLSEKRNQQYRVVTGQGRRLYFL
ncbi:unnamed protein product [Ectocarpus sp. 12 AP-2014]